MIAGLHLSGEDRRQLVHQLILHEGKRAKAYVDTEGNVTVGVGRNLTGKGLSEDEIQYLLNNDINECVVDLATFPWFVGLCSVRQRALVDLRFNLGPTRFRLFKRMIRALGDEDYTKAAAAMKDSRWYRQVKARGVDLVAMMATGEDNG